MYSNNYKILLIKRTNHDLTLDCDLPSVADESFKNELEWSWLLSEVKHSLRIVHARIMVF